MAEEMRIPSAWTRLAGDDYSQPYEVDVAEIYLDEKGGFVYAMASGCSCWDGEYTVERYDSLYAMQQALGPKGPDRKYHVSYAREEALVAEAMRYVETHPVQIRLI